MFSSWTADLMTWLFRNPETDTDVYKAVDVHVCATENILAEMKVVLKMLILFGSVLLLFQFPINEDVCIILASSFSFREDEVCLEFI